MDSKLYANLWKYTLLLVANKRVYVAVLGAYYLTIPNVTEASIGMILLAGSLAGFLFEIPSGYLGDRMGHKVALVFSRVCMVLSTLCFLLASDLLLLVLGSVFLALGHAFHSGTGAAFVHETLRALGREQEFSRLMGRASSIGFAVPVVFMIATPFLVDISFRLPFAVALIFDVVGLLVTLTLITPPVPQQAIDEVRPVRCGSWLQKVCGQVSFFLRSSLAW